MKCLVIACACPVFATSVVLRVSSWILLSSLLKKRDRMGLDRMERVLLPMYVKCHG